MSGRTVLLDGFTSMGSGHSVNQDYVLTGLDPFPHAIVCDGCSSSPHTDLGSRLLAWAARDCLRRVHEHSSFSPGLCAVRTAYRALRALGLGNTEYTAMLDATLLLVYIMDGHVCIHVDGDGVVAVKKRRRKSTGSWAALAGPWSWYEISYSHNAPRYLSYSLDGNRSQSWLEASAVAEKYLRGAVGERALNPQRSLAARYPVDAVSAVLVATDGIGSFRDRRRHPLQPGTVIESLTGFKNANGRFLQRRAQRQLQTWSRQNILPEDDLAVACLLME